MIYVMKSDDPVRSLLILLILFGRVIIPKIPLGLACQTIGLGFGLTTGRPLRTEIWSANLEVGAVRTKVLFYSWPHK